jgi:hypothetical protein
LDVVRQARYSNGFLFLSDFNNLPALARWLPDVIGTSA